MLTGRSVCRLPGVLPALSLPVSHLLSPCSHLLFSPGTSVGRTRPPPVAWHRDPSVQATWPHTVPFPPGPSGRGLLALSQGGPAHHLLTYLPCRQHNRQTLGQGSDTARTRMPGSGCVPARTTARSTPFPKCWNGASGHSTRSQGCWGQVPALPDCVARTSASSALSPGHTICKMGTGLEDC